MILCALRRQGVQGVHPFGDDSILMRYLPIHGKARVR